MKAPDKIYVTIDRPEERVEYNPELVGVAWSKPDNSCEHEEYIRKAALLEWANEKKAELLLDEDLTDVAAGINMGMDMLIHKLNSL